MEKLRKADEVTCQRPAQDVIIEGWDEIWGPRAILAWPLFSPAGCRMPGEIFPEIQLVYASCMVLSRPWCARLFKRELNCYFQSPSFFAWLAFVTTLKPEEVLGAGSLFSIHIFWRWKQAGLCCSCTEDVHLVSVQGAPAPFSAGGCCWSWNAITEAVVRGSNLLKKKV